MPEELQLSIEKLVYGGDGLGHAHGNTVFVAYVLPEEEVRGEVTSRKKKLVWAKPLEILRPSADRVKPQCPHFTVCGGCHYQHANYETQVRLKTGILRETLSRMGGVDWSGEVKTHTAAPFHYRNRAQWAVRDANPHALGYFFAESNAIVPVDRCDVLSPRLGETFLRLQELTRGGSLPAEALEVEAFVDTSDSQVALNVAFKEFSRPVAELAKMFQDAVPGLNSLLLLDQKKNRFELTGPGYLIQEAGGFQFRIGHLSFFQVNRFLVEDLLRAVTADARGGLALDLYAGVGFFTLPLTRSFDRVVSVDANLSATRNLRENAETASKTITSHHVQTEKYLSGVNETPDFVVLDPPRTGLGQASAEKLANLGPQQIAYLSCDPSTLARDLAILLQTARKPAAAAQTKHRYEIESIEFFDLFPQTFHIETLVRLRRM